MQSSQNAAQKTEPQDDLFCEKAFYKCKIQRMARFRIPKIWSLGT